MVNVWHETRDRSHDGEYARSNYRPSAEYVNVIQQREDANLLVYIANWKVTVMQTCVGFRICSGKVVWMFGIRHVESRR